MFRYVKRSLLFGLLAALFLIERGDASDLHAAFMKTMGETRPPIGHVRFCRQNRELCRPLRHQNRAMALSEERWDELQRINTLVNKSVLPATDKEIYNRMEHWTFPARYGDCEDYVLLKRHYLIEAGWPAGSLLVTVVREQNGEGHAVLTVRTDRGDFILDNQRPTIHAWLDTPYTYLKRQSPRHPALWEAIQDQRGPSTYTASTR